MVEKNLPFDKPQVENIINKFPTPFHLYDEALIRNNARRLNRAFAWKKDFKNYFAIKATPNPSILKILKEEGMGMDCSSLPELLLAKKIGIIGEEIMFSSNNTPTEEFILAKNLGAIINLDDFSHLDFLEKQTGLPELLCFRYNPGASRTGNSIIGKPEEAKYGLTKEQLFSAFIQAKNKGVKRFGIHTMLASNELNPEYFIKTAKMLFALALELHSRGIILEFVNLGGGIGIPYHLEQQEVDLERIGQEIEQAYQEMILQKDLPPLKIFMECARLITGPAGFLITKVRHIKNIYRNYIGVDASMADLMRPAIYGAYHHITIFGKENQSETLVYDVTGSLCENNDKFAIKRSLPKTEVGNILIIHDTGAHGHAMGFNYNGKLRSAELLLKLDGFVEMIRRAETVEDYFQTLNF